MIEIIPNWHPIFVHFTIGLLSISAALFWAGTVLKKDVLLIVARWNLWLGALITIGTVLAGLYAFNTVPHNTETQHLAMLDHRMWALSTTGLFVALALWSFVVAKKGKNKPSGFRHHIFLAAVTVAGLMLAATGFKGGELVYRHGLGVLAVPVPAEEHHESEHMHSGHDHGDHHH